MSKWFAVAAAPEAAPEVEWTEYRRATVALPAAPRLNILRGRTAVTGWDTDDSPHRTLVKSDEDIELI